jgi:serine/threonine-protein kinase
VSDPEQPPPPDERLARIGEVVGGRYQIVSLLGEGGMGMVYEAKHTFVGRRFAIKFLRPEYARDQDMLVRFQREARAAGALESENIAAVTDFGVDPSGAPFIVMEHLAGDDLGHLLARTGRMAVSRAVGVIMQACRGLAVAHASWIVHRDLKPGNLFVLRRADGGDLVKVIDFGIAKLRSAADDAPSKTKTGAMMGTPHYMPPEQARGQREIDHRADIYALGAILYEALAGAKPHEGDSYNAILFDILNRPPTPLRALRPGLPEGLCVVVERAMAFEPEGRLGSAAELADALAPYAAPSPAAGAPAPVAAAGAGADADAFTMRTPPTNAGEPEAAGAPRTPRVARGKSRPTSSTGRPARDRAGTIVAVALVLAAGGGLWAWRARGSGPRAEAGAPTAPAPAPAPPALAPPPIAPPPIAPEPAAVPAAVTAPAEPPPRTKKKVRKPEAVDIDSRNPYESP